MTNEEIKFSLETRKLKLSKWNNFSHFGIVGFFIFIPLMFSLFLLNDYLLGNPKPFEKEVLPIFVIPTLLGVFFYIIQKNRLKFKEVNTNLNRKELKDIIKKVAIQLEWNLYVENNKIIIAKTHPEFMSGSWGEQITILFDNRKVLINSICDPDKKSSIVSMGRNKQNENRLIEEIKKASSKKRK